MEGAVERYYGSFVMRWMGIEGIYSIMDMHMRGAIHRDRIA
jgi:hypothetical protein